MQYKINGEQPFQVLSSSFSISPSQQNTILQVSSDGINYSDLFAISAGQTKMCTNMSNGSYYRLKNNTSEVVINWVKDCGGSGGGTGPQGPAGPQGPQGPAGGGEGGDSHILLSSSAAPATLNEGDVWAFYGTEEAPAPADKPFSSITKTHVEGERITFYLYNSELGGKTEYEMGIDSNGDPFGPWGYDSDAHIIPGPWGNEKGISVSFNGSEVTFTTLMPEDGYSAWMCDFNPPVVEPQEGWHAYQVVSGTNKEIALKEDLPTEEQLLVTGETSDSKYFRSDRRWVLDTDVIQDGLRHLGGQTEGKVLMANNEYTVRWGTLDSLMAVSALPRISKDGSAYAYTNENGYGIVQAQGGTTELEWVTAEDSMTGWTQARVPYATNDAYVVIATETNTGGLGFGWNGSSWYDAEIQTQVDGEFTQEFAGGVICNCVREGDYLVLTFNMPCINTWSNRNDEFKMETTISHYTNAVMSDVVTKIWSGTQAQYDALGTYDNNTFYIIL